MPNVVFVVPFAMEATLRFVRAAANLRGLRLAVISQQEPAALGPALQSALSVHERVADALDPAQLVEAVRRAARGMGGEVDAILGILEQLQEPLAIARERLGVPGMGLAAATNFRDKARMKDVLRGRGLPCARHALVDSVEAGLAFAREGGLPLVVKPPAGAGAKNTFRVDTIDELRDGLAAMGPGPARRVLLEEFVQGREHSFDTVTLGGRHVFHSISRYFPGPLEVMETPWIQWCVLLPRDVSGPEFDPIRAAGTAALDALGAGTAGTNLMTHMEWFAREDESIAISEVAARPPGAQFTSLIGWAHDVDFYSAWARLMAFGRFEPPARRFAVGAAFLRGQGEGRVEGTEGVEQAQRELGPLVVEAKLPQRGQPRASSYEGEGYVIVRHEETGVVEDALRRLVSTLRVRLR